MQCEEVRDQFTDYLGDNLAEPARSEVQKHLIDCILCRDEAQALKGIWMKLESIPADRPDSAAMRARFDVMLDAYRQGMDHAPAGSFLNSVNVWIGKWWPKQPVFQFGLTAAAVLIAVVIGQQYRPAPAQPAPTTDPKLVQLQDEIHNMQQLVVMSLMQQQSASERLKGVSFTNQIEQPDTEILNQLMDTLMHDSNVNVRLAAVDALKKFGERQMVRKGMLDALASQDAPLVQAALIDYVVEAQRKDSVDTLRLISKNTEINETIRKHAEWGLEQLQ